MVSTYILDPLTSIFARNLGPFVRKTHFVHRLIFARNLGDKFLNRIFSSARVEVEHVISGVKRCRIVKDVLRLTKKGISDLVMEIACGLHNFPVSCRRSLETFALLSFASSLKTDNVFS